MIWSLSWQPVPGLWANVQVQTTSLERALHAVDVMTSILTSGETGAFVDLRTTCTRPEPLGPEEARWLLVEDPARREA